MKISLKAARVNANLTRKDVSERLGFSTDTLKNIENGKRDIKVSEFEKMCEIYKCTKEDIFLPFNSP